MHKRHSLFLITFLSSTELLYGACSSTTRLPPAEITFSYLNDQCESWKLYTHVFVLVQWMLLLPCCVTCIHLCITVTIWSCSLTCIPTEMLLWLEWTCWYYGCLRCSPSGTVFYHQDLILPHITLLRCLGCRTLVSERVLLLLVVNYRQYCSRAIMWQHGSTTSFPSVKSLNVSCWNHCTSSCLEAVRVPFNCRTLSHFRTMWLKWV